MALTRKLLESMGIDEKQIESIIEAHGDTVTALKAARDKAQEESKRVPELLKQLEEAQAQSGSSDEWKRKAEESEKALADYKAQVEAQKAEEAKAKAYRDMLAEAGVDPKRIDTVMRVTDMSAVEVKDGKLEKADELKEAAKKEWADFIIKTKTDPTNPAEPPKPNGGIEGADPDVSKRLQERHERLYGKSIDTKE